MKNAFTCVVFFLMVLCFFVSVDAQTLTPTSSTNLDSFIVKQNVAVVKSADSSSNNLKHKINKAYKQLDKYPLTHPYVNKLDSLKGKIVTGYKKIDSSIFADTGNTIKAAILRQLTTKKADSTNRKPLNEIVAQQKLKLDTVEQKPRNGSMDKHQKRYYLFKTK
jgi:predicted RND superfamily exporter protein